MRFLDGDRVTPGTEQCHCTGSCEFPCWQRIGLTKDPCCPECGPLPDYDEERELSMRELEQLGALAIYERTKRWPLHVASVKGTAGVLVRGFSSRLEAAFGAAVLSLNGEVRTVIARTQPEGKT